MINLDCDSFCNCPKYCFRIVTMMAAQAKDNKLFKPSAFIRSSSRNQFNERSSNSVIVDPQTEVRRINERIDQEMRTSELVSNAKMMGFNVEVIKEALKRWSKII